MSPPPRAEVEPRLALDLRSLAVFRIALTLVLIGDLASRAPDLALFYTDAGVLPRETARVIFGPWQWSLNLLGGSLAFQQLLLVTNLVAAACLLIGWQTRWATIATWTLYTSLNARNPLVLEGGDLLLGLCLFWGIFLPLDAHFAVGRQRARRESHTTRSIFTVALTAQLVWMYWSALIHRGSADWWRDFTALYYALSLEHRRSPGFGDWIYTHFAALKVLTATTLLVEALAPLFVLSRRPALRLLAVMTMIALHAGMGLTMRVGIFPAVCVALWLAFLPSAFWHWLASYADRYRGSFAELPALPVSASGSERSRSLLSACCGVSLVLALVFGLMSFTRSDHPLRSILRPVQDATRLYQSFVMFSPRPPRVSGWWVVATRAESGAETDALRGGPVSWSEPRDLGPEFQSQRGSNYRVKLMQSIEDPQRKPLFSELARVLCERVANDSAQKIGLSVVRRETQLGYRYSFPQRVQVGDFACAQ